MFILLTLLLFPIFNNTSLWSKSTPNLSAYSIDCITPKISGVHIKKSNLFLVYILPPLPPSSLNATCDTSLLPGLIALKGSTKDPSSTHELSTSLFLILGILPLPILSRLFSVKSLSIMVLKSPPNITGFPNPSACPFKRL